MDVVDTLMVLLDKELHILTSAKKGQIIEPIREMCKTECGVDLKITIKSKGKDPTEDVKKFLDEIKSSEYGKSVKRMGVITKEEMSGTLCDKWNEALASDGFDQVNISDGLSRLLACKDESEITNIKKAAFMSAQVMQKQYKW